jgi:hypothetical protein
VIESEKQTPAFSAEVSEYRISGAASAFSANRAPNQALFRRSAKFLGQSWRDLSRYQIFG